MNACYCSVHKYILRNVFTDLEHNDVEIWRFLLWDRYIFPRQVTASAVFSALLHKHSHLPDFKWPVSAKKHLWTHANAECIKNYSKTFYWVRTCHVESKPNWVTKRSAKRSWTHVRFQTESKSRNAVWDRMIKLVITFLLYNFFISNLAGCFVTAIATVSVIFTFFLLLE